MAAQSGAQLVAQALKDLGVTVIFGIVGIPVVEIAEEAILAGIRFLGFRNEQAASYAATAYGYLTGRPGVCLVVGGPGVLHAVAGIGNASVNAFPLLLLAGSSETHLVGKGAFQELDAVSLLAAHTKLCTRPGSPDAIPDAIAKAYRAACFGRPGTGFVDLPADLIQATSAAHDVIDRLRPIEAPPKSAGDERTLQKVAQLLREAKAPLVVIGKGAAYGRAEHVIREFVERTAIPFLPTPMGKGVVPDSHPLNVSAARSTALRQADVVLVLGARLNWILHFGEAPKWNARARFVQVDMVADELGRKAGDVELSILGDVGLVVAQLSSLLAGWRWPSSEFRFTQALAEAKTKNERAAAAKARDDRVPMTFAHAFDVIRTTLERLSPPRQGGIVYVSEGANTMDLSRSIFRVEHARLRLDAGTAATMGVGLGYAIAAHAAYHGEGATKKIVAFEGDSAFGFSGLEVETMARYGMDVLIFVMNNGGVYHGDADSAQAWFQLQDASLTRHGAHAAHPPDAGPKPKGLRSTSLGWEVRYDRIADACGGRGFLTRTPSDLAQATVEGFRASVPVVVNVMIEAGANEKLEFGWQASAKASRSTETKL
ncbi:MAG: hypothetical protein M1826_003381 [Phylliscum demangeonii]|nr:MAG: hypothetical protein M1826_003381 [Phylliscum demangeonii]